MAKAGILHDYDLHANLEPAAQEQITCALCGATPPTYQWSDYHGEGMCTRCGCPYQLRAGSDEQVKKGKYPDLNLADKWVPVAKEYWEETQQWVCLGTMLGARPGLNEFFEWVEKKYPELFEKKEAKHD